MAFTTPVNKFGQNAAAASTVKNTTAFSPAIPASALVMGAVVWGGNTAVLSSVKDDASTPNTYTQLTTSNSGGGGGGTSFALFWLVNPASGSSPTTLTATFTVAQPPYASIFIAYTTGQAASPLDLSPANATGNSTTPTATSITPSVNGEFVFFATGDDAGLAFTNGSNVTILDQDTLIAGCDAYEIQSAAAAIAATVNCGGGATTWVAGVMSFKPATAGDTFLGAMCL